MTIRSSSRKKIIVLFALIFLLPIHLSYASYNSFIVNIPNSQGNYTSLEITKTGNGYTGPKGEYYSSFPTVYQLQSTYDIDTTNSNSTAIAPSDDVQREKMLEQQADEANKTEIQKELKLQQLMNQQIEHNLQQRQAQQLVQQNAQLQAQQQTQQQNQPTNILLKQNTQHGQSPIQNFLNQVSGYIFLIIIGICGYTCFHATKGRMLFFYNWYDVLGSFATLVLPFALSGSKNALLIYMGEFAIVAYNLYMSYTYYYPKKQYLNLFFVGLSRIIMTILLPQLYLLGLFLGPKRGDSSFEQITDAAVQFGWYYYLTKFLYCLVNGHLLVEIEQETFQYKQNQGEPTKKTAYEILDVLPTDPIEKIKTNYRSLMMKYHPDRMSGLGEEIVSFATTKTQEINAAYEFIIKTKGFNHT